MTRSIVGTSPARGRLMTDQGRKFCAYAGSAQRRLGGVEPQLGGRRQAAFPDHGHEITQVPQLHSRSIPERYATSLQSLFHARYGSLRWPPWERVVARQVPAAQKVICIDLSLGVAQ